MESDLIINHRVVISGAELGFTASRAGGPGGQCVNTTSSRISLRWNIAESKALTDEQKARVLARLRHRLVGDGELLIHVDSERSQIHNRRLARERLAQLVKDALVVQKRRIATKPTSSSKNLRIAGKKLRGVIKQLRRDMGE